MQKYFNSQDARNLIDSYDFAIFPIHGIKNGKCTCNKENCSSPGKHPATPDGFKSASKDIERVKKLWAKREGLNVGIATGKASGIFVVDCDTKQAYTDLKEQIKLPDTLTVKTGRGYHIYFKWDNNRPIKNGTHVIDSVDIRGEGGYVAGVGSNHQNGEVYSYINPLETIAQAPQELYDLIQSDKAPLIPSAPPATKKPLISLDGWSQEDTEKHLSHIDPDCDYDTWIKIGMALHEEGAPFHLWDDWSKRGAKYDGTTSQHWKSFHKGGGVTYGTVVALAKQGGWEPRKREKPLANTAPEVRETFNPETGEIIDEETQGFPLHYASDLKPILETNDFIEDLLRESEFSVIYGESNCGKTFFMLDLAMHVALGMKWRDKRVEQGGVIYAALEGGYGTQNRICAFKQHHGIEGDIPLAVIRSSIDFLDAQGDIQRLAASIKEAKDKIGDIKLVVVDTLARAISGGDENSGQDMGQMIVHADYLRELTGAHISFVHHSGKDKALGARGHSSLRAAVDTEIEVSREHEEAPSQLKIVKQREMEMIEPMFFELQSVELGQDKRFKTVTSCVPVPCEGTQSKKKKITNPTQQFIYDSLVRAIDDFGAARVPYKNAPSVKCVSYDELREVMEERGFKEVMATENKTTTQQIKSATQSARLALQKLNLVSFNGRYIWIIEEGDE